jgi:hypothetical protein
MPMWSRHQPQQWAQQQQLQRCSKEVATVPGSPSNGYGKQQQQLQQLLLSRAAYQQQHRQLEMRRVAPLCPVSAVLRCVWEVVRLQHEQLQKHCGGLPLQTLMLWCWAHCSSSQTCCAVHLGLPTLQAPQPAGHSLCCLCSSPHHCIHMAHGIVWR